MRPAKAMHSRQLKHQYEGNKQQRHLMLSQIQTDRRLYFIEKKRLQSKVQEDAARVGNSEKDDRDQLLRHVERFVSSFKTQDIYQIDLAQLSKQIDSLILICFWPEPFDILHEFISKDVMWSMRRLISELFYNLDLEDCNKILVFFQSFVYRNPNYCKQYCLNLGLLDFVLDVADRLLNFGPNSQVSITMLETITSILVLLTDAEYDWVTFAEKYTIIISLIYRFAQSRQLSSISQNIRWIFANISAFVKTCGMYQIVQIYSEFSVIEETISDCNRQPFLFTLHNCLFCPPEIAVKHLFNNPKIQFYLVESLTSTNTNDCLKSLYCLTKICAIRDFNVHEEVRRWGVFPTLSNLLEDSDSNIIEAALNVFLNTFNSANEELATQLGSTVYILSDFVRIAIDSQNYTIKQLCLSIFDLILDRNLTQNQIRQHPLMRSCDLAEALSQIYFQSAGHLMCTHLSNKLIRKYVDFDNSDTEEESDFIDSHSKSQSEGFAF